jgi:hypothetical protein
MSNASTNLLRRARAFLDRQREAHLAEPVVYRRPGKADLPIATTLGTTEHEGNDDYGATIRSRSVDFLVASDVLLLEPRIGHQLIHDGRVYEVMDVHGDGPWRWSDPYRTTYRIHTRETGPAEEDEA